jgi:hypothetical protein
MVLSLHDQGSKPANNFATLTVDLHNGAKAMFSAVATASVRLGAMQSEHLCSQHNCSRKKYNTNYCET